MLYEQIKQAAENFIEAINKERIAQGYKELSAGEDDLVFNAYLAGIKKGIEIKELRNPWISVEDRLPENGDMVFTRSVLIIKGGGERHEEEQFLAQKFVGYWLTDCCRQHRMHGFIYDTLDKVTHWMPIPQLLHDDMLINGLNEMNEHFKKGE